MPLTVCTTDVTGELDAAIRMDGPIPITVQGGFNIMEILRVTVPAIDAPIYLDTDFNVIAPTGTATVAAVISSAAGNPNLLTGIAAQTEYSILTSEANGRKFRFVGRIPPNSPGDWIVGVNRVAAPTASIVAGLNSPAALYATRH